MKIGFLTACLPRVGLDKLVPWAAEQGFRAIEWAAWPVDSQRDYQAGQIDADRFTKKEAEKIKQLLADNRMIISAMAYYDNNLHPDLPKRNSFLNHLQKVIDAAQLLGVKLVGTFVGARADKTPGENMKEIGEIFRE